MFLTDEQLDRIRYRHANEESTLADVDDLLRYIRWLEGEWAQTDDAFGLYLQQQNLPSVQLPGYFVYQASGGGVGVWMTDDEGNRLHEPPDNFD